MLGTLIGLATVGGVRAIDPISIQNSHMYMMGLSPVVGFEKGSSVTYSLGDVSKGGTGGRLAYEFGGLGYSAGATRASSGVDFKPLDLSKVKAVDGAGKSINLRNVTQTGLGPAAMSTIGPLMSAGFIVSGFKQDGFAGAMDAYFLDVATASAMHAETFETTIYKVKQDSIQKSFSTQKIMQSTISDVHCHFKTKTHFCIFRLSPHNILLCV